MYGRVRSWEDTSPRTPFWRLRKLRKLLEAEEQVAMSSQLRYHPDGNVERASVVSPVRMNAWEKQEIFREMVVQMLRNGPLSQRRRKLIVQYAAGLGLSAIQAGRFIEEARVIHEREFVRKTPRQTTKQGCPTRKPKREVLPRWFKLIAGIIGILLIYGLVLPQLGLPG